MDKQQMTIHEIIDKLKFKRTVDCLYCRHRGCPDECRDAGRYVREVYDTAIASLLAWDEFIHYMKLCSDEAKDPAWGEGCEFAAVWAESRLQSLKYELDEEAIQR